MTTGPQRIDPTMAMTGLPTAAPLSQRAAANMSIEQNSPAQAPVTPAFASPGNN